jgi:co-chaperonin GroES (HSP10)
MEKKIILLGTRVLVEPDAVSDKLSEVIDVVKTDVAKAADRPQTGLVVEVADDCKFVQIGDRIHFNQWAGLEVEVTGQLQLIGVKKKKYLIMAESEVMMITERP